ncbi:MAG TPA: hypothetical protein VMV20_06890 [Chitinophagaceae bacterium]|nr:hypothetical protein [Chitinophagaceae bacterium]
MNRSLKIFLASFLLVVTGLVSGYAQETGPQMDDLMHRNGKIYVVVAVLVVIFIGIVLFLVGMERRVSKLEKQNNATMVNP